MSNCCDIPVAGNSIRFLPDEILVYGLKLNAAVPTPQDYGKIDFGEWIPPLVLKLFVEKNSTQLSYNQVAIAAAYGYAFEGHCYRFDRFKVLVFEYTGVGLVPVGCGFDPPANPPPVYRRYSMWNIRGDTRILELTMNVGDARSIVLEANLPGKRAPNTYSALALAHRGGKLVGPGIVGPHG